MGEKRWMTTEARGMCRIIGARGGYLSVGAAPLPFGLGARQ
jgi:hypothetical protein